MNARGAIVWLWWPVFDPLHEDPRFQRVLESENLGDAVLRRTPR